MNLPPEEEKKLAVRLKDWAKRWRESHGDSHPSKYAPPDKDKTIAQLRSDLKVVVRKSETLRRLIREIEENKQ